MSKPSSRNLSHDFPAYKGLTLREMLMITVSTTSLFCLLFIIAGLLTGWVVALGCIGLLLGFIVSLTVVPAPVARLKSGKPYGYLRKRIVMRLTALSGSRSPYLAHKGFWRKSQRIRRPHV